MISTNYRERTDRRRLSGQSQQRGTRTGTSAVGTFLFGGLFVVVGTAIILVGLKVIPVDPASVKAPYWVLAMVGAIFAGAGVMVCGMGVRQVSIARRCKEAQRQYPDEPAFADFPWNPNGIEATRWRDAFRTILFTGAMTVFLIPFNWWAISEVNWFVRGIVGIFDVVAIFMWCQVVIMVGRALKFGDSRLEFARFPYRLSEPITIRWVPPHGIGRAAKGDLTLRCVEEWWEVTGTGKNRNKRLVHEEVWSGIHTIEHEQDLRAGLHVNLTFTPPLHLPTTALSSKKPVFWEFEVKLDLDGFDFEQRYLVPVYAER